MRVEAGTAPPEVESEALVGRKGAGLLDEVALQAGVSVGGHAGTHEPQSRVVETHPAASVESAHECLADRVSDRAYRRPGICPARRRIANPRLAPGPLHVLHLHSACEIREIDELRACKRIGKPAQSEGTKPRQELLLVLAAKGAVDHGGGGRLAPFGDDREEKAGEELMMDQRGRT